MKELVIISGKGGTGKTSLTASLAAILSRSKKTVCVDCDVDAADLHLVLAPTLVSEGVFTSGREARIDPDTCTGCGLCAKLCRFDGIEALPAGADGIAKYQVVSCEGCGVCFDHCPAGAISFEERDCGIKRQSSTRFGPLFHARLYPGAENSGKLVSLLRKEAREYALASKDGDAVDLILCDGSPGTGCPVIASITGADAVLVVTEPTLSGRHDLERVVALCRHFGVKAMVAVNKADINREESARLSAWCDGKAIPLVAEIPWNRTVTAAQTAETSTVEYIAQHPTDIGDDGRALSASLESLAQRVQEELWKA